MDLVREACIRSFAVAAYLHGLGYKPTRCTVDGNVTIWWFNADDAYKGRGQYALTKAALEGLAADARRDGAR